MSTCRTAEDVTPFLSFSLPLHDDGGLHFSELEMNQLIIGVTVAVIFDQELERLFFLAICKQEAGRFRDKLYCDQDIESERDLDDVGNALFPSCYFPARQTHNM